MSKIKEILRWLYTKGADLSDTATTVEINQDSQRCVDQAYDQIMRLMMNEEELINLMTEQWQVRDMIYCSIIDEKRRKRVIKALAQAIHQEQMRRVR